ncbi:tetratricopeptide repeat-containing sensor histidine kinase [Pedobacter insulae]|uniref:histidine kinase n=1 Tax=Pedobacter insulae TaxID=414048 RepID=A0A1I2YSY4_9SPHI|nr:tetratricopeptide repeat protein [Pedobacter insulae]SFH28585.1 Signal transduction histidine kinase [Pedobacter insulae]
MKYLPALILFISLHFQAKSQNQKTLDSLTQVAEDTKDDRLRLKILGDLCWSYGSIDFDKALFFGKSELQLAERLNDSTSIALAYSDIGNTYMRVNKLKDALSFHLKSYALRENLGLKAQAAGSISNISIIYKQLGNYKDALNYMHRSLKIYEEENDEAKQAVVLNNIGNVYLIYQKFAAAKESYQRAISIARKTNSMSTLAIAYGGMFKYYYHKADYQNALKQALIAERYLKSLNMQSDLATVNNNIGQVYEKLGKYEEAMKYFKISLDFRIAMNDQLGIASCYKNIGATYTQLNDYVAGEKYIDKSIAIFKAQGAKDYLREAYDLLGALFEQKQDYANALKSYKGSVELKDSIYSKEATNKINELQIAYETEKKAQQIIMLNKENEIQKLILFKRNVSLGVSLGALLLTIALGFLVFKNLKIKQRANLQKEIIKQQDLATKSILYAEENERKRISADLHDGLGQLFSAVKMNLSALSNELEFKNDVDKTTFQKTLNLVDESCREVRAISHQMAPNVLLKSGLATAVRDFINKIDARKLKINLETVGLQQRLDQNVETVLYRIIQESVNNVIKHANANTLDIQLIRDEEGINATIEDNGLGFDATLADKFDGIGLKNIRSRVEYLKGQVDFSSQQGAGTLVAIYIPL